MSLLLPLERSLCRDSNCQPPKMSYRQGGGYGGGRAPVRYDDVDAAPPPSADRRAAPPPHMDRYGSGPRGGAYDRYSGASRGYDRDNRDGYRGGRGGHDTRRSRSPPPPPRRSDYDDRAGGKPSGGSRPKAHDYDDDYDRRDRGELSLSILQMGLLFTLTRCHPSIVVADRRRSTRSPPPPRAARRDSRSVSPARERSRSPPRRRRRYSESRSPSPRGSRDRSPPPAPRDRRRGGDDDEDNEDRRGSKRGGKGKEVVTADDAADVDAQDIAALMGFGGFGTTQVGFCSRVASVIARGELVADLALSLAAGQGARARDRGDLNEARAALPAGAPRALLLPASCSEFKAHASRRPQYMNRKGGFNRFVPQRFPSCMPSESSAELTLSLSVAGRSTRSAEVVRSDWHDFRTCIRIPSTESFSRPQRPVQVLPVVA